jgi:hypothetical protein
VSQKSTAEQTTNPADSRNSSWTIAPAAIGAIARQRGAAAAGRGPGARQVCCADGAPVFEVDHETLFDQRRRVDLRKPLRARDREHTHGSGGNLRPEFCDAVDAGGDLTAEDRRQRFAPA